MINWREKIIPLHFKEHLQKTNGHLWKYGLFMPINVFQCSLWVTQLTTHLCFFATIIPSPLSCHHQLKIFCFAMARSKAHSYLWDWVLQGTGALLCEFLFTIQFSPEILNCTLPNSTLTTFSKCSFKSKQKVKRYNPLFSHSLPTLLWLCSTLLWWWKGLCCAWHNILLIHS